GPAMLTRDEVRPQALHSIRHHASLVAGGGSAGEDKRPHPHPNRDEVWPQAGFIPAVPRRFIPFASTRRWWQEGVPRGRTGVLTRASNRDEVWPQAGLFRPSPGASFHSPPRVAGGRRGFRGGGQASSPAPNAVGSLVGPWQRWSRSGAIQ